MDYKNIFAVNYNLQTSNLQRNINQTKQCLSFIFSISFCVSKKMKIKGEKGKLRGKKFNNNFSFCLPPPFFFTVVGIHVICSTLD